jgi:quinol monooxygenase YgiN
MITLNLQIKVKPGGREEFLEALRVLFDDLAQEQSFIDAWIHTTDEDPDLIVVYERWKETKESFIRDILLKPAFKPYLAVFEKLGVDRKVHWLETRHAWRS